MKAVKTVCIILCILMLFSFVTPVFAEEAEGDIYLPEVVLQTCEGLDNSLETINNFDRYERAYEEANLTVGGEYKVEFQSGGADHTHQYIASSALRILANDKGDCVYFTSTNSSTLIENADWPDSYDMGVLFNTHFYNPYTETSYGGGTNTAKVKANDYYTTAVSKYKSGDLTGALEQLGRGAHFVADACEGHHATNKTAVGSNHSAYEKYIDTVRTQFTIPGNTLDESVYEEALVCSVGQIVRNNSYASYCLGDRVTTSSSSKDYYDAARATVLNGVIATVQYYYKFAVEVGIYN